MLISRPAAIALYKNALLLLLIVLGICSTGCATVRVTDPYRTATEQFLLSGAASRAVAQLSTESLKDRKVYVDPAYFAASDQPFVLGELRARLLITGVRLVPRREDAEVVMEVRSGGVGIDRYEFLIGLSASTLGSAAGAAVGTNGSTGSVPVTTPELALLKNSKQNGVASVAFVAYWANSGEVISWSGPFVGRTIRDDWWILGYGPRTTGNIPPAEHP